MRWTSKLEHCPECKGTKIKNLVSVEPGKDVEIFVECCDCCKYVARYTLKMYTCDKPYESFLRLMHHRRMSSGNATKKAFDNFQKELTDSYNRVKEEIKDREDKRRIEDILGQT